MHRFLSAVAKGHYPKLIFYSITCGFREENHGTSGSPLLAVFLTELQGRLFSFVSVYTENE